MHRLARLMILVRNPVNGLQGGVVVDARLTEINDNVLRIVSNISKDSCKGCGGTKEQGSTDSIGLVGW